MSDISYQDCVITISKYVLELVAERINFFSTSDNAHATGWQVRARVRHCEGHTRHQKRVYIVLAAEYVCWRASVSEQIICGQSFRQKAEVKSWLAASPSEGASF